MFDIQDLSLGKFDKFYVRDNSNIILLDNFGDAIEYKKRMNIALSIDSLGVYSVLANNFIMGNTTIDRDIKRTPWLSTFQNNDFQPLNIPVHG